MLERGIDTKVRGYRIDPGEISRTCHLPEYGIKILTRFEERLNEEVTHPIFGYKVKYRRCIELQARLLAKYLTGEINEYPPFITR